MPFSDDDGKAIPALVDGVMNAAGLALVHATDYRPQVNADGSVSLPSTYVATGGREARNTVHFALNHKVTSHLYGSWDNTAFAIVAPFAETVKQEGPPAMLMPSDTYWTTNAKNPLRLPGAMVVTPAEGDMQALYAVTGSIVTYKTRNFTEVDEHIIAHGGMEQQRLAQAKDPGERARILQEYAMAHATHAAIAHMGFAVEPGNQWSWVREDYSYAAANALAETLGTKGSVPHMQSGYHRLAESMNRLLTLADYYEARAGTSGNAIEEDDGYVHVAAKSGARIGSLRVILISVFDEPGTLEENIARVREEAQALDPRTQDVARDFGEKIAQRIAVAKEIIASPQKSAPETAAEAKTPGVSPRKPEFKP